MEKDKIYFVYDPGEKFWMLGRCTDPLTVDNERNTANYISSDYKYHHEQLWCYQDRDRNYRNATPEEIIWFEECERQKRFISKKEINFSYSIY